MEVGVNVLPRAAKKSLGGKRNFVQRMEVESVVESKDALVLLLDVNSSVVNMVLQPTRWNVLT